jgi:hypothetical protein
MLKLDKPTDILHEDLNECVLAEVAVKRISRLPWLLWCSWLEKECQIVVNAAEL